jgi:hypothetical protein
MHCRIVLSLTQAHMHGVPVTAGWKSYLQSGTKGLLLLETGTCWIVCSWLTGSCSLEARLLLRLVTFAIVLVRYCQTWEPETDTKVLMYCVFWQHPPFVSLKKQLAKMRKNRKVKTNKTSISEIEFEVVVSWCYYCYSIDFSIIFLSHIANPCKPKHFRIWVRSHRRTKKEKKENLWHISRYFQPKRSTGHAYLRWPYAWRYGGSYHGDHALVTLHKTRIHSLVKIDKYIF